MGRGWAVICACNMHSIASPMVRSGGTIVLSQLLRLSALALAATTKLPIQTVFPGLLYESRCGMFLTRQ